MIKLDQQIWRLPHFVGHVVRGERLNPWFPLAKRHSELYQNSSGVANSRAFYIKLVTNTNKTRETRVVSAAISADDESRGAISGHVNSPLTLIWLSKI